jgi:hypothetical protein
VEVDLNERGVRVSALDVGFPKQESERTDADEHNDYLKKDR